jgi:hypothetical protein
MQQPILQGFIRKPYKLRFVQLPDYSTSAKALQGQALSTHFVLQKKCEHFSPQSREKYSLFYMFGVELAPNGARSTASFRGFN